MSKQYAVEQVEPQILRITWDGVLNRNNFREATETRVEYAKNNLMGNYVLIFNLSKAIITMMDIRFAAWAANIDPHMIHTIVIGRHSITTVVANMLVRLSKLKVEFADNDQQALDRARKVIAQHPSAGQGT